MALPRSLVVRSTGLVWAVWYASVVIHSFYPGVGGLVPVLACLATIPLWWLILAGVCCCLAFERDWRRAGRFAAVIVLTPPALLLLSQGGDYGHLVIASPYYRFVAAGQPGPVRFPWGDAAVTLDGLDLRVLVYDASGETARLVGAYRPDGEHLATRTTRLLGGFYLQESHVRGDGAIPGG